LLAQNVCVVNLRELGSARSTFRGRSRSTASICSSCASSRWAGSYAPVSTRMASSTRYTMWRRARHRRSRRRRRGRNRERGAARAQPWAGVRVWQPHCRSGKSSPPPPFARERGGRHVGGHEHRPRPGER